MFQSRNVGSVTRTQEAGVGPLVGSENGTPEPTKASRTYTKNKEAGILVQKRQVRSYDGTLERGLITREHENLA